MIAYQEMIFLNPLYRMLILVKRMRWLMPLMKTMKKKSDIENEGNEPFIYIMYIDLSWVNTQPSDRQALLDLCQVTSCWKERNSFLLLKPSLSTSTFLDHPATIIYQSRFIKTCFLLKCSLLIDYNMSIEYLINTKKTKT